MLRMRIEDKCPTAASRWPGMPGEDAALARPQGVAEEAGLALRRERKVPEMQPPGFVTGGVEGFTRVAEGLFRAAR
jgi:hypothetical protein